jgi:CheY-like chemotaxis protein
MTEPSPWILLVEDDPIFSMLFCRAWKGAHPSVSVVVAPSLAAMRDQLATAAAPPRLVVMDQNLPDGNGHKVAPELELTHHCWSALGEGGAQAKPQGKSQLEEAVGRLAGLAGL